MKLFLVLALLSSSAFARELICNLNEGTSREIQRTEIIEGGVTELNFTNKAGNTIYARAQNETVTLTVDVDGNRFKTSSTREAELSSHIFGQDAMIVSCRITKDLDYCAPASN